MKNIIIGILSIFFGIIVIILDLKFQDNDRADYRAVSGAIIFIMIGLALIFGLAHL
ncbi:MAG: hypothetical protein J0L87_06035 [Bacteroidetes bacterium]|nr:hypothetical protein [Bacteroidota bacterium]